ncbi:unnamed protein product, partial [Mesorhabditis spiculigera]
MGKQPPSGAITIIYRIALRVAQPSNAMLEAVVFRDLTKKTWKIDGDIERNNKYGNTSACVVEKQLLKLCHCIN